MKKTFLLFVLFLSFFTVQAQMPSTLSPSEKVYGLSKFWQEVNYNFIYLDKIDKKMWDSTYKSLIVKVQETKNDYEYYREMERFCALLKDGHTNIFLPQNLQALTMTTMFGDYRLFLKNIAGKVIVEKVNLSKKDEIPIGSEIVEVNGFSTQSYLNQFVKPYISSSTDYVLEDIAAYQLLKGLQSESFQIKIITPDEQKKSFTLIHKKTEDLSLFPKDNVDSLLVLKWLDKDIAYLALNSFENRKINKQFEEKLPELYKAKGLVIDLRKNGGGNTDIGTSILQYLTNDKVLQRAKYQTREHLPSFKAWGVFLTPKDTVTNDWNKRCYLYNKDLKYYTFDYYPDTISITAKRIVIPTTVLVGHSTASAAEDFLVSADNQKHFTRIGENSFGSTGQPFLFSLPGGGNARVCTKKDTYPDGREFVGVGIKPNIEVKLTLKDYIAGKDVVLEKAMSFLKDKLK